MIKKTIPNYPGYYATDEGDILSTKQGQNYKKLSQRKDNWGYYQVNIWKDGKLHVIKAHKLVASAFLGEPVDPAMQVDHKDGDKTNNRPTNLEYVTPSENLKRAYAKGLRKAGENNTQAKLTDSQVIALVERANNGETVRSLAKEVNVCESTLYAIFNGTKRKYLTEQGLINYKGSYKGSFSVLNKK